VFVLDTNGTVGNDYAVHYRYTMLDRWIQPTSADCCLVIKLQGAAQLRSV